MGGGIGGATVARYVAKQSKGAVDVILIEAHKRYTTCFFSNWYLADFRTFDSITHDYLTLEGDYGIKVIHQYVTNIDADKKMVMLQDGSGISYNKCVVASGIDFVWIRYPAMLPNCRWICPTLIKVGNKPLF